MKRPSNVMERTVLVASFPGNSLVHRHGSLGGGGVGVRVACVAAALNPRYRAYGLYKWFRRVRRPAAMQARLEGVCRSKNLDSGMFLRRKIWFWVAFLG